MPVANTVMPKADMRKLLNKSKQEPVHCALGLGDNPAVAALVLHKTKKDRALETVLKSEVPAVKNTRWGTAFVDMDDNPKLVKFTLNKPVSGMARKLVKTLKGTGFTKVIILTEDGSEMDSCEEDDDEAPADIGEAAPAPAAAAPPPPPKPPAPPPAATATPEQKAEQAAALSKALAALIPGIAGAAGNDPARKAELEKLARDAVVNIKTGNLQYGANAVAQLKKALEGAPPPAPPPPPAEAGATPEQKAAQTAALSKALAALIPGIAAAGTDPARKAALEKLARDAAVNLKTGNLQYGANFVAQLKKALEGGATPAAGGGEAGQRIAASRAAWTGMRQQVEADVATLRAALASAYDGQPVANEVVSRFQAKAAPLLARFDGRLGDALDGMATETDAAKRAALQESARGLVQEYRTFAESDPFIADLDGNPFVPLQIRSRTAAALATVAQAIA